jgi:outer membrane protein assembly factor BamB
MSPISRTLAPALALALLALPANANEPGLLVHWGFTSDRTQGTSIKAWYGGPSVTPSGDLRFANDPPPARLELPATNERLAIAPSPDQATLPTEAFTVEAWVRLDRPVPHAAIFSAASGPTPQDRGFYLGLHNDRPAFALSTQGHPDLFTLLAPTPFSPGTWHHLVGTYDGRLQHLFVNGQPAASATSANGPLTFATHAPVLAGALPNPQGDLHRLPGALHDIRLFQRALTPSEIQQRHDQRRPEFPAPTPDAIRLIASYGPFADWRNRSTALITWETTEPMPSIVDWTHPTQGTQRFSSSEPARQHAIEIPHLEPDIEYSFRLVGPPQGERPHHSVPYLFDASFHYLPADLPPQAHSVAAEQPDREPIARHILDRSGVHQGWCLILGAHDGRLALDLVRLSQLKVLVLDPDPARVLATRQLLARAGIYGVRASVQHLDSDTLPHGTFIANLVVSESTLQSGRPPRWSSQEIQRLLRPSGGTALLGSPRTDLDPTLIDAWRSWIAGSTFSAPRPDPARGLWLQHTRPKLEGAGDWSHQYGSADNTSASLDEHVRGDLQVSWWGDPGPRPMPDRGPRNPAPLSVNGRLYIQGDRVLFGLDTYNGAVLWSVITPEIRRANLPRDCSNMVADDDRLFVAHHRYCIAFDGQTGVRKMRFEIPESPDAPPADWGYLSAIDSLLIGSRVKTGSRYLGDDGEWYEDDHQDQVSRVTSESLFGLDRSTGKHLWTYRGGAILNATITAGDGMIFFLESRNPAAIQAHSGRLAPDVLTDQHLVALDLRSGRTLWTQPHDLTHLHFMTYLVYSRNTLVATGTDRQKNFHVVAFNAPSPAAAPGDIDPLAAAGQVLWTNHHKEDKGHHSGHLQHPVVVDGTFYSDQRAFNLASGETTRKDLPERRGCGTMSAARHALFFRHHFHGMWDLDSDRRSQFEGIRGGCWLGLIPAGGMLLAPESSAGCSCTHAIQTSVGYLPASLARTSTTPP